MSIPPQPVQPTVNLNDPDPPRIRYGTTENAIGIKSRTLRKQHPQLHSNYTSYGKTSQDHSVSKSAPFAVDD